MFGIWPKINIQPKNGQFQPKTEYSASDENSALLECRISVSAETKKAFWSYSSHNQPEKQKIMVTGK